MESNKGFFRGSHVSKVRYMERLFHEGKIQTPILVTLNSHFRKTQVDTTMHAFFWEVYIVVDS